MTSLVIVACRNAAACRNEFPQLAEVHALKEGFLEIWDAKTRPEAEREFTRWANDIPLWLQKTFWAIAKTVDTWSDQVCACWDKPITNAYTEAVNGVTKGVNRMGRGYSFDVLRARLLYYPKARTATAVKIRVPVVDSQPEVFTKTTMNLMINGPSQRVRYAKRVIEF